eukprot:365359-Chlamydomonas_euryale.AAC.10
MARDGQLAALRIHQSEKYVFERGLHNLTERQIQSKNPSVGRQPRALKSAARLLPFDTSDHSCSGGPGRSLWHADICFDHLLRCEETAVAPATAFPRRG